MAARADRKKKHLLTVIPDDDRPISYRFTVVVVGKPCKDFVTTAVESEMAENYHPGGAKPKNRESDDEEDTSGDVPELPALTPSANAMGQEEDDKLVLFCPTGPAAKELVRLRFKLCAGFSDAMPLTTDRAMAAQIIVVFLFWRVSDTPGEDQETVGDTISDWRSRMAEINHKPAAVRPFVTVLAFGASDAHQQAVNEFIGQQKTVNIVPAFYDNDSEETFMEALQTCAEQFIEHQQTAAATPNRKSVSSGDKPTPNQPCCSIS